MKKENHFDLIVIGAGPGGYTAAIKASQDSNKKVCLIEQKFIGGTCLNVGCIPTKCLLANAHIYEKIKKAKNFGINIDNIEIDFEKIIKRKNETILNLRQNLKNLIISNNITIKNGLAQFIDKRTIEISEINISSIADCHQTDCHQTDSHSNNKKEQITADKIIIATGSTPINVKDFPFDCKYVHSSNSILNINNLPSSLVIIGGGYIGCEFASFFNSLGSKVTIIEASSDILNNIDIDIKNALKKDFIKNNIDIITNTKVEKITVDEKKQIATTCLSNNQKLQSEMCLVAIGRKPLIDNLGLEKINIETKNGRICVNKFMQTSLSHIFAIGDVTGNIMLAHTASHEALIAAANAFGKNIEMNYSAVPYVIFTEKEIASCGLTSFEAKEKKIDFFEKKMPLSYLGKAQANNETTGFVKLIIQKPYNQIIGAHMYGEEASTMIAEMALAITNELTLESIIDTIHAHPTLPEAWHEVALIANNTPINSPPIKK